MAGTRASGVAVDFATRPCASPELRLRAALLASRASLAPPAGVTYAYGALRIDTGREEAFVRGALLRLSHADYLVLAALARSSGRAVAKRRLSLLVRRRAGYDEQQIEGRGKPDPAGAAAGGDRASR